MNNILEGTIHGFHVVILLLNIVDHILQNEFVLQLLLLFLLLFYIYRRLSQVFQILFEIFCLELRIVFFKFFIDVVVRLHKEKAWLSGIALIYILLDSNFLLSILTFLNIDHFGHEIIILFLFFLQNSISEIKQSLVFYRMRKSCGSTWDDLAIFRRGLLLIEGGLVLGILKVWVVIINRWFEAVRPLSIIKCVHSRW